MNVLVAIRGNEPYVSQQAQIILMKGLQEQGVNILLIGEISDDVLQHVNQLNIPFIPLFPKSSVDKSYIQKLKTLVSEHQIDIMHCLDGRSCRNGLLALKKTSVKIIAYFGSMSLHWYDPTSYLTYLNPRVDRLICNSQHVYDHVTQQLFGKQKKKTVKIYKGYDPEWFTNQPSFDFTSLNIPKEAIVVCFVGNHRKVKGTRYFLESSYYLNSSKDIHYVLIGDQTDAPFLASIAEKSPMAAKIHTLGKRSDVVSLLKGCDLFAQTSLSEGFGRAISEAMCVGKPIVMTDAGGCTELIDAQSGIITPLKDPKAIAKAILKLAEDDALRLKMGSHAKQRIGSVYHINDTIKNTLALYYDVMGA